MATHGPDHNSAVHSTAQRLPGGQKRQIREVKDQKPKVKSQREEERTEQRRERLLEQDLEQRREERAEQRKKEVEVEVEVQVEMDRKMRLLTQANTQRETGLPVLREEQRRVLREIHLRLGRKAIESG